MQPTSCDQALPDALPSRCDYQATLRTYCATSGCHGGNKAAGLDLRVDPLLIARILDVPAKHGSITCSGSVPCVAAERTCDECDACPESALLVNRQSPAESWIPKKMEQFVPGVTTANLNIGCGETMPSFLTNARSLRFPTTTRGVSPSSSRTSRPARRTPSAFHAPSTPASGRPTAGRRVRLSDEPRRGRYVVTGASAFLSSSGTPVR